MFFGYAYNLAVLGGINYISHKRTGIRMKQQKKANFKLSQIKILDKTDEKAMAVISDKLNK